MKSSSAMNPRWAGWSRMGAVAGCLAIGAGLAQPASGINISTEYSTDFGGDESPSWDPNGKILKKHFKAAVKIWERLLPGPGPFPGFYEFDFQWDDDLGATGLGLTTDTGIDLFIEINPLQPWWIDTTPNDSMEFMPGVQTLFQDLSGSNQSTIFPGTTPPGPLEVGFRGTGLTAFGNTSGQPNVNANTGFDLLSTIVHEIGHVLGIAGVEPGEYNIFPQHVGGLTNVLVLEDNDSGHLGGDGVVPFLMCQGCGALGVRRFPTATDVLVIGEDQGITNVRPDRVGSISNGLWGNTPRWIGGAVPNQNQDVYISHGGTVTLNANGGVRDLRIDPGNTVDVQNNRLNVDGTLTLNGTVNVDGGGTLAANNIILGLGTLTTAAGSRVRFNSHGAGVSATFNGSLGIGFDNPGPSTVTFNPTSVLTWNIAEELSIGDENTTTTLVIDGGATFTSATGRIGTDFNGGGEGIVEINGLNSSWTVNGSLDGRNGLLSVLNRGQLETGSVSLGDDDGEMRAGVDGLGSTWIVNGNIDIGPSTLTGSGQGGLTVQNNGLVDVSGDVDIHGTSTLQSFVIVQTNGTLDVDGSITIGPFGSVQLLGSTIRAAKLLPFLGTFTWTNGILDLTNQEVILDSGFAPLPLAANTTLQNSQTLILNGVGRDLIVGESANGQLDLLNTASVQVNNGDVFIAKNAGSVGTVRLLGANTSFFVDGSMAVGGDHAGPGGLGQLIVAGDLTVTDTLTYWSGSSVQVNTTGVLSADTLKRGGGVGGGLSVNTNGHVRFNILEGFGANISMGGISAIGIAEGDTGQGSLVRNTGEDYSFREGWIIGDNATAQVDLINGGDAGGDGFVHMGNRLGSGGTVLNVSGVDGFGFPSQLFIINKNPLSDSLVVGVKDVATMNVTNGGRVHSSGAIIARELTASGSQATVSGQNSKWEVGSDLVVGGGARGQLTVENRGLVEIDRTLFIGGAPKRAGGDGGAGNTSGSGASTPSLVKITGPVSRGIAHQDTVVGFNLAGDLVVEDRGALRTDQSAFIAFEPLSRDSSVVVSTRAGWKIEQDLFVGNEAKGTLQILSEGNVSVTGVPTGGNVRIAAQSTAGGSMATVSDSGTWDIAQDLYVGDQAQGALQIDTKGRVTVGNHAIIADQSTSGGSGVTVLTDGIWDIGTDLRVGEQAQGSLSVDSRGVVLVGGDAYLGAGSSSGDGTITLTGIDDTQTTLDVTGILYVGGDSTGSIGRGLVDMEGKTRVRADRVWIRDNGQFDLAGVVDAPVGGVNNRGLFTGQGQVIGTLINRGVVAPGNSAGGISVTRFAQSNAGQFVVEIGGDTAGTSYDQLVVDQHALLNGTLDIALLNTFLPDYFDEFVILTADTRSGEFDTVTGALVNPDMILAPLYDHNGNVGVTLIAALPGDANLDGTVNGDDLLTWQANLFSGDEFIQGDFNLDGSVNGDDLLIWQAHLFDTVPIPATAPIPEPGTAVLLLSLVLGMTTRRRVV